MSKIYKITNDINNKIYVGKTSRSLEERFAEHCSDRKRAGSENRPLYRAMNKYGIEHFSIDLIEECQPELENERESYWIGFYHGYDEGYNATRGGDGLCIYNYDKIYKLLCQGKTVKEITLLIGCCVDVVYSVAKTYNFPLATKNELAKQLEESKKKVAQYSLQGEYIQTFDSYSSAAKWLVENGKAKSLNGGVRGHIGDACKGIRKTAYKYIWKNI